MVIKEPTLIETVMERNEIDNPVLLRCCKAWVRAHQSAVARGVNPVSAMLRGNEAYRNNMPPLSGADNIRDYIACVAHGMVVRTIIPQMGTRLLYAAQVALAAYNVGNSKTSSPHREQTTPPPSRTTVKPNLTAENPAA